jgi:protein SCO1/2
VHRRWKILLATTALLLAAAPAAFVAFRPVTVIPRLSLAPGFALVDQAGERLTSDDLKGSLTLYGFTYGGCGPECPDVVGAMAEVAGRLPSAGLEVPVRLVTVSFDPERDTPPRLAAEAGRLGADPSTWSFAAAADTAATRAVVGSGFGVWYQREPDGEYRHDPVLVLVDGLGVRRVEYRTGLPGADRVVEQMRELAVESRAQGAMRFAYEAAHFLSCYSN